MSQARRATSSDSAHSRKLVEQGLTRFGQIDVLINNASELGPTPMPELERLEPRAFVDTLNVNVVAPLRLIQLVLPGHARRDAKG